MTSLKRLVAQLQNQNRETAIEGAGLAALVARINGREDLDSIKTALSAAKNAAASAANTTENAKS